MTSKGEGTAPPVPAERSVAAVLAIGAAMATTRDHSQMLAEVIGAVCASIGATSGGFMSYDTSDDALVLQAPAFGVHAHDVVSRYRVPVSQGGNAARVFLSREPYIANDTQHDPRFIQRFVRLFDTVNSITVPLVLHDRPIGIFHGINKREGDFTDQDLTDLSLVAPLLASCLQSALTLRAFEAERHQLVRAMAVHEQLLDSALGLKGVEGLCQVLHSLIDRPLALLDGLHRPLEAVDWRLDLNQPLFDPRNTETPDGRVWHLDVEVPPHRIAVVTIPIGSEHGGYLLVDTTDRPLDAIDIKAIEQAATFFAVEIFRKRSTRATESRAASALLLDLFSDEVSTDDALVIIDKLDFPPRGPWRVILCELHTAAGPLSGAPFFALVAVVREAIERGLGALNRTARPMLWRDGFVIVTDAASAERFAERTLVRRLRSAVSTISHQGQPLSLRLGIGRPEAGPGDFAMSLKTAEQALRALARLPNDRQVMSFEDLGVYRLLLGTNQAHEHQEFASQVLEPVLAFDRRSGRSTLLDTLRALVSCTFNAAETSRYLGIHINTVKYRTRQLQDLLGSDPGTAERRLEIELALKILDLD
jgi:PucR family transcriptional regulator, purine catabolism regulatory protein